jgi:simple sugar transport system ATP-binding protein
MSSNTGAQVDSYVAELVDVSKHYGPTKALSNVTMQVREGETHALLGRNGAGKSTAVSILTGLEKPDSGEVRFGGEPAPKINSTWRDHVSCLYQHSTLIPAMTVTENLFVDQFAAGSRTTWLHRGAMRRQANTLLAEWEIPVDPDAAVEDLSFEQRQLVEIARSLSRGSKFIVLDEPTAQLNTKQINRLFASIKAFQQRGISFLYISHFLREVFEICDRATVLRDGRHVMTQDVADVTEEDLISAMVGNATIAEREPRSKALDTGAAPRVTIADLSLEGEFSSVNMTIRGGEVHGLAGSTGSGATAFGEVLAGLRSPTAGQVTVAGKPLRFGRVDRAIEGGIGYVPQDRRERGFVGPMSIAENLTMTIHRRLSKAGFISGAGRDRVASDLVSTYEIKVDSIADPVDGLSGGNQQKVVVGRAVASTPELLVMDSPTAGIDVASVATLSSAIDAISREGVAVLVISNTISELRLCDTVQVMFDGQITRELSAGWEESEMVSAIEGA